MASPPPFPARVSPAPRPDPLAWRLPPASGVLRAGPWQIARRLGWLLAVLVVLVVILSLQSIARSVTDDAGVILALAFVTVVLAYGAYALLVRAGENRTPCELALRRAPRELLEGIAIGGAIMGATVGVLALTGLYQVTGGEWTDWAHDIRECLGTGLLEELLARLVIFRILASALGVRWSLALSAALFGGAHLANPGATLGSALAIAIEAGLTLAAFYLLTGRIWTAVGVHAGWNFVQGAVFGATVSGMPASGSLLVSVPAAGAPDWLSGGSFGPEASPVAVVIGLVVFILVIRRVAREAYAVNTRPANA